MKRWYSSSTIITEDKEPSIYDEVLEELKKATLETTGHGLPRLILARNIYVKLVWIFCLFVSIGFCAFMIFRSVSQYFSFEVNSLISDVYTNQMIFPAIAICNNNPMISENGSWYIQNYYQQKYNVTLEYYSHLSNMFANGTIEYESDWLIYKTYHPDFPSQDRILFGYPPEMLLANCKLINTECNISAFQNFYHPSYGNCYKFNGNTSSSLYNISRQGDGFDIEIFTGISADYDFFSLFYEPADRGAVIIIDDQDTFPIRKEGIFIRAGNKARMILTKTTSKSLASPYSDCKEANNVDTMLSREMARHGYAYSRRNCMIFCEQKQIIDQLGCYDLRLPRILDATPCYTKELLRAISKIRFNFSECFDPCPFECATVTYDVSTSYDYFPTFNYYYDSNTLPNVFMNEYMSFELFKGSVAAVSIYYDQLMYTDISDSPTMLIADLIANIGGTLGLFIGVSILSFIELVELAANIIIIYRRHLKERRQKIKIII